ncbi:MAG: tetratricopeptide repeat protein [Puniceicoccaceae bacterium]
MKSLRISYMLCMLLTLSNIATATIRTSAEDAYQSLLAGEYESAIIAYEAMLSTEPARADFQYNLGIAYFHSFRFQSALRAFDRAVQLSIEDPDFQALAEFNIGVTLFEQSKLYASDDTVRMLDYLDQAVVAFENTVELDPNKEAGRVNLMRCRELRNKLAAELQAQEQENPSSSPEESQPEPDPSDPETNPQSGDESDAPESDREPPASGSDPDQAKMPDAPKTRESSPGTPSTDRLSLQEALLLLDALEHSEKRITLSELNTTSGDSESTDSEANW